MSVWFLKVIDSLVRFLAIASVFAAMALLSNLEVKDLDIWLHLASGRYILGHHVIPRVDFLSCSVAGQPWVNHEWLFQIGIASIYQYFGTEGWIVTQGIVVGLILILLTILSYTREANIFLALILFFVLHLFEVRMFLRPDMVSLLFYLCFLFVLFKGIKHKATPWLFFILQIIWANMHGFFIVGPLTTAIIFGGEWLKRHSKAYYFQQQTSCFEEDDYVQLKKILIGVFAACFINPFFIQGVIYPFKVLFSTSGHQIFYETISELQKPVHWGSILGNELIYYKLLIVVSAASFFFNRKRINFSLLVIWLFFLIFSLSAIRNILYFAVTACVVTFANLRQALPASVHYARWNDTRGWYVVSILFHLFLIGQVKNYVDDLSVRGYFDFEKYERKSEFGGVSLRNYPYKAVDFLVKQNIKGNFFNDFNSGAYLLGKTFPDIKVYMDGRTEVHGSEFYKIYNDLIHGETKYFDEVVNRYHLTGAFLNSVYVPLPEKFLNYVYHRPDWKLIYFDHDAMIFLKDIPENRDWIEKFAIDLSQWTPPKADLLKYGVHPVDLYRYTIRAKVLFSVKLYDQALAELKEASRIMPNDVETHKLLTRIYHEKKAYDLQFEYARKAKVLDPDDMEMRYYLAESAFELGDIKLAEKQCRKILEIDVHQVRTRLLMSRIYFAQDETDQSFLIIKDILKVEKLKFVDEISGIMDDFVEKEKYDQAREVYQSILSLDSAHQPTLEKMQRLPK